MIYITSEPGALERFGLDGGLPVEKPFAFGDLANKVADLAATSPAEGVLAFSAAGMA